MQGSVRPGRPLLPWLGEGTGPYRFPFATPFPKLQGECTSAGPNFLRAFAQTAPSALPQHCQALPLANSSSLPKDFSLPGIPAQCSTYTCPNPPDHCGGSVPLTSSTGWVVGSVGEATLGNSWPPYIPQGWLRTSEDEGANTQTAMSSTNVSTDDLSTAVNRAPHTSVTILKLSCSLGGLTASPGAEVSSTLISTSQMRKLKDLPGGPVV